MLYVDRRTKNLMAIWISAFVLYANSIAVIAQDKYKNPDYSNYKVKLALSQLPVQPYIPSEPGQIKELMNSYTNFSQASLKISSSEKQNLLVSYINDPVKLIQESDTRIFPVLNNDTNTIANTSTSEILLTKDPQVWNRQVKTNYKNGLIKSIKPGVKYIKIRRYINSRPVIINIVEVNRAINNNISIEPVLAGKTLLRKQKVANMVRESRAIAGVNASFFKQSTGNPLGTLVINEELITGPIFNRVVLGISEKDYKMAKVSLEGKVIKESGEEITINNVNQPRMLATYTLLYSDKWGSLAPSTPKYGIQVAVEDGIITNISTDRLQIPKSGFVIVGPAKNLGNLKINDKVSIKFSTTPDWSDIKHAVSGGPYLVKDGKVYVDIKEQKMQSITGLNPRTAVGYTKDNRLIIITIDGRQRASSGVSLFELAKLMREFGCYNAMNLDGGSSTQMIVENKIVNNSIITGGSYVSNGLIVKEIVH